MKVRLISILAIIAAGVIVLVTTISTAMSKNNEYNSYLQKARANAEKEVPYTACQNYINAFKVKCDDEKVYLEYLEQAKILGENIYESAVKNFVVKFPESPKAYEFLCEYYYAENSQKKVLENATAARDLGIATERVRELYLECFYTYKHRMTGLEEAYNFLGSYALIKKDGLYGYAMDSGAFLIAPQYKAASPMFGTSAAVNDGKEWYMINTGGYKVARPTEKVSYLSFVNDGMLVIGKDGKYGYTNQSLKLPETLEYDKATVFKNGVAAVKKDKKWALLGIDGKKITDFEFDDIKIDDHGACISNGVIFAKKDGKYSMYNADGKKISKQAFDDAYPFVGSEPAAVCIDKKWGFVNAEGKIVIEPQYTEAKSFSIGIAPVSVDGMWGYISSSNEFRIDPTFTDAKPFASNGYAAVKENNVWNYIQLFGYID